MMEEIWKDIPSLKGFFKASNKGRIKSCERYVFRAKTGKKGTPSKWLKKEGFISLINNGRGYLYFTSSVNNNRKNIYVHRAVAEAFLPNRANLKEINHKNGNKADNRVENLEWCDRAWNVNHAYKKGLQPIGGNKPNAIKLIHVKENKVFECIKDAAKYYGVKYGLLKEALRRNGGEKKNELYKNLIPLSQYVEENPEEARKLGLSQYRLTA